MATTTTNKTTHYELSQYTANDKTSYLVNYNSDMDAIDSGIYDAQAKANTNETSIGTLSNLTTDVKSTLVGAINEVDSHVDENTTHIGNLSNLSTYENSDLVRAINEVDSNTNTNTGNIGNLPDLETTIKSNLVGATNEVRSDFRNFASIFKANRDDAVTFSKDSGTVSLIETKGNIRWNSNSGAMCTLDAYFVLTANAWDSGTKITINTPMVGGASDITIKGAVLIYKDDVGFITKDLIYKANGNFEIAAVGFGNATIMRYTILPFPIIFDDLINI